MSSQTLRLIYPRHLVDEPVFNNLLRQYDFTVNIIQASITPESGWINIKIIGKTTEIENAVTWLKDQGVEVLSLSQ